MSLIKIPPEKTRKFIEKHFDTKSRRSGDELVICNPLNGDSGYHFNISLSKGVCHDWRGDEWAGPVNPKTGKRSCNIIRFASLYLKCSTADAIKALLDGSTIEYTAKDVEPLIEHDVELPIGNNKLNDQKDDRTVILKRWLNSRGYDDEEIVRYDLRSIGTSVIWPYYEFDHLVYWQSRSYLNKKFRFPDAQIYKDNKLVGNCTATKGMFLYGIDELEFNDYLIIVEAIFDKHSLGSQAVATGGAVLTSDQLQKIRMINPKKGVILAPDNDKAGIKSVISNYKILESAGFKTYFSIFNSSKYDGSKDWNELITKLKMSKKDIREVFDSNIIKLNLPAIINLQSRVKHMSC